MQPPCVVYRERRPRAAAKSLAALSGGGETGEILRSMKWDATGVSLIEHWPQSLRTAVSILLETKFPMYIAWGETFTQFYNDAFLPILGTTKHPAAMGSSTQQTFAESWDTMGPIFTGVRQGEAFGFIDWALPFARRGFLEECYFNVTFSPIRDEGGNVGGVLGIMTESTTQVLGERRLRTLLELAERAIEVKDVAEACRSAVEALRTNDGDVPFALMYLLSADQTYFDLVASAALPAGSAAAPLRPECQENGNGWPLAEALQHSAPVVVSDVATRFGCLSVGKWPEAPNMAVALRILRHGESHAYGVLIVGVSPRLLFDDGYREFFELVAGHFACSLANARAHEEKQRRAEMLAQVDESKTVFLATSAMSSARRSRLCSAQPPMRWHRRNVPCAALTSRWCTAMPAACCGSSTPCWIFRASKRAGCKRITSRRISRR